MASTEKSRSEDVLDAPSTGEIVPDSGAGGLSDRDRRILDFEREWTHHRQPRDEAVRERFGLSTTRYYQVLNAVIDSPAAIAYDPMLVRRLQRVREIRANARTLLTPRSADRSKLS